MAATHELHPDQWKLYQHSTAQHSTAQYSIAALPTWPKQPMPFDVIFMHSVQDGPDPYVKYSQPAVYVIAQGTRRLGCTHSACTYVHACVKMVHELL